MSKVPAGTLVIEGERSIYYPDPPGLLAAKARGHTHAPRIITWTLEGPLRAYVECGFCCKGEPINPSRLIRKVPQGFSPESWAKFLDKADERAQQNGHKSHSAFLKAWRARN